IPTNEDVVWGINKEQYAHRPPIDKNKMKMLNVKFTDFNNLSHYIVECSKIGILDLLKSGISLKGIKIKI
ncbi:Imm9 family immunity protein, partial [Yersinia pseudotuberculosis]|uniref:Imm9 family immunity protein n=1 Tax=Yersinia pseudotuberculosis TaxID=633 RepID=UPI000D2A5C02